MEAFIIVFPHAWGAFGKEKVFVRPCCRLAPESSPATMSTSNSAVNEAPVSYEPSGQPVDQDASTDAAQSEETVGNQADSKASASDSTESETRDPPNEPGKMFIGRLSWQTDQPALNTYFSKYREVKDRAL